MTHSAAGEEEKRMADAMDTFVKKKEYLITEQGKSVFKEEKKRLEELLENAKHMDENVD